MIKKIIVFFAKFVIFVTKMLVTVFAIAFGSFCGYFAAAEVIAEDGIEFTHGIDKYVKKFKCRAGKETVVLGFRRKAD